MLVDINAAMNLLSAAMAFLKMTGLDLVISAAVLISIVFYFVQHFGIGRGKA